MNETIAIYWLIIVICVCLILLFLSLSKQQRIRREVELYRLAYDQALRKTCKKTIDYKKQIIADRKAWMICKDIWAKYGFTGNCIAKALRRRSKAV